MLKAIIIDDEINGAEVLQHLIQEYCPNVSVTSIETSTLKAIKLIEKQVPDVIFLDIEMPDMSGFELLEKIKHLSLHVIFTTAYNNYALRAFKYNTIDYLLKPIIASELIRAVSKLETKQNNNTTGVTINHFLEAIRLSQNQQKIAISSLNEIIYIETEKITRLESDSNYTNIFLVDGKNITSSKTLKEYENLLNPNMFFRTHKAFIINLHFVEKYVKSEGGYVVMKDNAKVSVSREKRQLLMDTLAIR